MDFTSSLKQSHDSIITHLKETLKTIRTGRANPGMIEGLIIEAYGGQSKLRLLELAGIINEGPTTVAITPYDPSTLSDIEKAILKSPLGMSPKVQGQKILVITPALSEEQREKYVKVAHQFIEEHKHQIRGQRDEARKKVKSQFELKEITEDEKFRFEKEIDEITHKNMELIQTVKEKKEAEIREV